MKARSQKKLILIDLDKTLIDRNYQLTASRGEVAKTIRALDRCVLGVSSDSAIETIGGYTGGLGISFPIVAENGAIVVISKDKTIFTRKASSFFVATRRVLAEGLFDERTVIIIGDVNAFSRFLIGSKQDFGATDRIVLINGYRKASLSLYCLAKVNGVWNLDKRFLDFVVGKYKGLLRKIFPLLSDNVVYDINYEYGICIARLKGVQKSLAVPVLVKSFKGYQIFAIGDSMGDFYDNPKVIQCAVANASEEYKKKCHLITKKSYTAGVLELLKAISSIN